jgi:hypothetical protein
MPPITGGMNEQDYRYTIEVEFLDRIYSVILKWRNPKIKRTKEDNELIAWLVKEKLMGR